MRNSVKKSKAKKNHLFILPSGNVINKNKEGIAEEKYLNLLSGLLEESYDVTFIEYPERRTALYSSAYFKKKAAARLAKEIDKAGEKKLVLLGISAGADVIMKYLAGHSKANISKVVCAGLFIGEKRKVRACCEALIFLYGEDDLVGIIDNNETVILKPESYAPSCIRNISASHNTIITYKIMAGYSHTLLSEKRAVVAQILKNLIAHEP